VATLSACAKLRFFRPLRVFAIISAKTPKLQRIRGANLIENMILKLRLAQGVSVS
jgi:hypothetical protein